MHVIPVEVHGKRRYRLDLRSINQGQPTFETKALADAELENLKNQQSTTGKVWMLMTPQQRNDLLSVYSEIMSNGKTLREVWESFKTIKSPISSTTLRKAIEEVIEAKKAIGRRQRYVDGLQSYLKAFSRGREETNVAAITAREIDSWFSNRAEAPQTRNSNLGRLSALFEHCWRHKYISENPCRRVESASVETRAPAILSASQCKIALKFTAKQNPRALAWLVLALIVGLRPEAEADLITWADIDTSHKRIHVKFSKTRRHRIIDLTKIPNANAWLILSDKKKSQLPMPYMARRRFLRTLRKKLGFERWPQDILRHTAASNLYAHHQDAGLVAAILGNSAGVLLRRYRALLPKEEAQKFFDIRPN